MHFWRVSVLFIALLGVGAPALRAQDGLPGVVAAADRFIRANPVKDLQIVFNQPYYAPSDTAFFGLFAGSSKFSKDTRKILNVDVIDVAGERVMGQKVAISGTYQNGQLILPPNIKPGYYTVLVYPDWMARMDRSLFVIHTLFVAGGTDTPAATGVDFFAGGGSLVEDIPNALIFHAPAMDADRTVTILTSSSQAVGSAIPDASGFGEIIFTPQAGEHYRAALVQGGNTVYAELPPVQQAGITIHRKVTVNGTLVNIYSRGYTGTVYALWCTRNGIAASQSLSLAAGRAELMMPAAASDGYVQLVLTDAAGKVLGRRWLYSGVSAASYHSVDIAAPDRVGTRSPVSVSLQLPPYALHASVRVIHRDLLGSAHTAAPADTAYTEYVNRTLAAYGHDLLPLQPLPAADEKRVTDNTFQYLSLRGTAVFAESGKPVPDSTRVMFFLQEQAFGYEALVRPDGSFELPLVYDVHDQATIFYAASHRDKDLTGIKINWVPDVAPGGKAFPVVTGTHPQQSRYAEYAQRKRLIEESFQYFTQPKQMAVEDPNQRYEDELGGVDITKETKDYVVFTSMSELVREILPAVDHRRVRDHDIVRVYTTHKRPTNFAGPLYILDGVLTKDATKFLSLKPADVISIKVVKDGAKLRHLGSLADHGVILVRTRLEPGYFMQENTFVQKGISQAAASAVYSGRGVKQPRIPDLRSCLYWNPAVLPDTSGKATLSFFTADDLGEYVIEVTGYTAGGEKFEAKRVLSVFFGKTEQ